MACCLRLTCEQLADKLPHWKQSATDQHLADYSDSCTCLWTKILWGLPEWKRILLCSILIFSESVATSFNSFHAAHLTSPFCCFSLCLLKHFSTWESTHIIWQKGKGRISRNRRRRKRQQATLLAVTEIISASFALIYAATTTDDDNDHHYKL